MFSMTVSGTDEETSSLASLAVLKMMELNAMSAMRLGMAMSPLKVSERSQTMPIFRMVPIRAEARNTILYTGMDLVPAMYSKHFDP